MGKFESLLVIFLIVLLLFGAKKLPELAKGVGESMKEIRKGFSEDPHKPTSSVASEEKPSNSNNQQG